MDVDAKNENEQLRAHISLVETRERQATEMCTWLTNENQRLRNAMGHVACNPFKIDDGNIVGPNLKLEAAVFVEPERQANVEHGKEIILDAIVDVVNGAYRSGSAAAYAAILSYDDRSALRDAIELLDALAVMASPTDRRAHNAVRAIGRVMNGDSP